MQKENYIGIFESWTLHVLMRHDTCIWSIYIGREDCDYKMQIKILAVTVFFKERCYSMVIQLHSLPRWIWFIEPHVKKTNWFIVPI